MCVKVTVNTNLLSINPYLQYVFIGVNSPLEGGFLFDIFLVPIDHRQQGPSAFSLKFLFIEPWRLLKCRPDQYFADPRSAAEVFQGAFTYAFCRLHKQYYWSMLLFLKLLYLFLWWIRCEFIYDGYWVTNSFLNLCFLNNRNLKVQLLACGGSWILLT